MSAIFGIYNLDGKPVQHQLLEEMSNRLSHRGSDNIGIWHDGPVGFGHRMLWTTPESRHEQLPSSIHRGSLVITADARIDNRDELLDQLRMSRYSADQNISDSEIILLAYEKWGKECTAKFLGDFAFAIWDKQNRSVFCARDHFGVKSLDYYYSENLFVFATEIKALLCVDEVPRALNETKISDHLVGTFDDVSSTFYKDIYKLPASCQIVVNRSGKYMVKYWSPDPKCEVRLSSNEEYAARFREIFTEAVRCRMRSSFTVGSMLSGGLDSSSITCTAQQLSEKEARGDLPTFSAIFNTVKRSDEQPFINSAISLGGLSPSFLDADQISPLANWESAAWHMDEPLYSFNLYMMWGIYAIAQDRGVRVILDGFDGDTTVSHGLVYLQELARNKRWRALANEIRPFSKNYDHQPLKLMWNYYNTYQIKPTIASFPALRLAQQKGRSVFRRAVGGSSKFSMDQVLNPDFVDRIDLSGRRKALKKIRGELPTTQKEGHLRAINYGVMQYLLEVVDRSASAFGIEARFPFWDKRLVDFCLSIPAEQKIQQGWTRFILRNAMTGVLPKAIQWRGAKTKLGHAFTHGFYKFENERIRGLIDNRLGKINQYVNVAALRDSFPSTRSEKDFKADELVYIWRILTLSLWLEQTEMSS